MKKIRTGSALAMLSHRTVKDTEAEPFALVNDPPKPPKADFSVDERHRQRKLFIGMSDLRGQKYLIPESNVSEGGA